MCLPELMKYNPKRFWRMLATQKENTNDLDLKEYTAYNKKLFYDSELPQEKY
jgi:hypothetical protein